MAKRDRTMSADKIDRWIKEGRGQGYGVHYHSWLTTQDVPSIGLTTRLMGVKIPRMYYLFSKVERSWFYLYEWSSRVVDIREQFPLLPLGKTLAIAHQCGYYHPPKSKEPAPLTTDLLVTIADGTNRYDVAVAVKKADALSSSRTVEKLEIERQYWQGEKVAWCLVTDREIPKYVVQNIEFLRNYVRLERRVSLSEAARTDIITELQRRITAPTVSLQQLTMDCDINLGYRRGSSLTLVYHLIATRQWHIDMHKLLDPAQPLELIDPKDAYEVTL